ncbi:MAG: DUF3347 domain-containing protein [Fibrobacterales bacterium]
MNKTLLILAAGALVFTSACNKDEKKAEVTKAEPTTKIEAPQTNPHAGHDHNDHAEHAHEAAKAEIAPVVEFVFPKPASKILPDPLAGMIHGKYNDIYKALITDDYAGSVAAAKTFAKSLANVPAKLSKSITKATLGQSVKEVSQAKDIDAVRVAFKNLSENVITILVENSYSGELAANIAYCPMFKNAKKTYWIQPTDSPKDPYHNKKMRRCGIMGQSL